MNRRNITKISHSIVFAVCMTMVLCCTESEQTLASHLLDEARSEMLTGRFQQARTLIDSLRSTYPRQTDVRRSALLTSDSIEMLEAAEEFRLADSTATFMEFAAEDAAEDFTRDSILLELKKVRASAEKLRMKQRFFQEKLKRANNQQ